MRKDVRLAKKLMADMQLDLPVADQIAQIWAASEDCIADADDFNCIIKNAGLGE